MILLVSADKGLQRKISRVVNEKMPIKIATTEQQIQDMVLYRSLILVVVDADMPLDTVGLCDDIHRKMPALPILYLIKTEVNYRDHDQRVDVCSLLDSTVDSVHGKDMPAVVLYALMLRLIRRPFRLSPPIRQTVVRVGNFVIYVDAKAIHVNNQTLNLPPVSRTLLRCLLEKHGAIVTYDELLEAGWGKWDKKLKRPIKVYIFRLRRQMGDWGRIILNVRGKGYRLDVAPRTTEQ